MAGISVLVSAVSHEHDGYTDNKASPGQTYVPPGPTEDFSTLDAEGYRIVLRWQSKDESFTVDYSYDDTDQFETQPYLTWVDEDYVAPPVAAQAESTDFPDDSFSLMRNPGFDTYARGHALTLEKQLSDAITLKSITAYRESGRKGTANLGEALPAGAPAIQFLPFEDMDAEQTSQEFQFIGLWDQFDLTAGAIYYNEKIDHEIRSSLSGPLVPLLFPTDPLLIDDFTQEAETDSYGIYAQGAYRPARFDDKLELILGVRYSDDKKDALRDFSLTLGGPVNLPAKFDEQRVDPAFTIRYEWTDNLNTYLRYATGYRSGGAAIRSADFSSFDKEENTAWELGLKSRWPGLGLQINLALFHNNIEGEQLDTRTDPVTNPSLTAEINSPKDKKVKGFEVELRWAATADLELGLNFAYMDADDFVDIVNPFTPEGVTIVERYRAINTPKHSGSVFADYRHSLPVGALRFYVSYAWADDYAVTSSLGTLDEMLPSLDPTPNDPSLVTARLSWLEIPVGDGSVAVSLWGKNLTDDDSINYSFPGCASGGAQCTYRNNPRTYGLEVQYEY